jgi:lipopolysaccharide heptosyltransferase II
VAKQRIYRRPTTLSPDHVRTILCQKYFGIGSIVHTIPLLRALRERYPKARIVFLTDKRNEELFEFTPIADNVIFMRFNTPLYFALDLCKVLLTLMKLKADISIDLEFFSNYSLLIGLISRARIRVGFFIKPIRPEGFLTHKVYFNHYRHISKTFLEFAVLLGAEPKGHYFQDTLPVIEPQEIQKAKARYGLEDARPYVILNTTGSAVATMRRWPAHSFAQLTKKLQEQFPQYQYVFIGVASEEGYINEIIASMGKMPSACVNVAGKTNFRQLAALLSGAALVISNDSGPMHVASLYKKNLIALFGPETPVIYGPINSNSTVFFKETQYCVPCLNVYVGKKSLFESECVANKCLMEISPEEVYAVAKDYLGVQALPPYGATPERREPSL